MRACVSVHEFCTCNCVCASICLEVWIGINVFGVLLLLYASFVCICMHMFVDVLFKRYAQPFCYEIINSALIAGGCVNMPHHLYKYDCFSHFLWCSFKIMLHCVTTMNKLDNDEITEKYVAFTEPSLKTSSLSSSNQIEQVLVICLAMEFPKFMENCHHSYKCKMWMNMGIWNLWNIWLKHCAWTAGRCIDVYQWNIITKIFCKSTFFFCLRKIISSCVFFSRIRKNSLECHRIHMFVVHQLPNV